MMGFGSGQHRGIPGVIGGKFLAQEKKRLYRGISPLDPGLYRFSGLRAGISMC